MLALTPRSADLLLDAIAARRLELQEESNRRYRDDDRYRELGQLADEIEALG